MRRFLDAILGRSRPEPPKMDRIFAMSTAYVTMQTSLGLNTDREAAIAFRPVSSSYFDRAEQELNELLTLSTNQTRATFRTESDKYGFDWVILDDSDFEDLVATIHIVSSTLIEHQFGDRLLAALFRFRDRNGRAVYWFYNFKRGMFYPFIPSGRQERDHAEEMRLSSILDGEIPVDPELERWYPMWEIPF